MDNQQDKKNTFYTRQPCLHGAVFQPTGTHTCVPVHPTGVHMCAPVHYIGVHVYMPVHYIGTHMCAPVHYTGMPVHSTGAHTCAHVQSIGAHTVHTLYPGTSAPMCAYLVGRHARVCAYYRITHAHGAHTQKQPLYDPPYSPCPKNETLILCRMIRPLT
jgi:hypothetical protein